MTFSGYVTKNRIFRIDTLMT